MKKSRLTEEQIAYALRLAESGTIVAAVCRQMSSEKRSEANSTRRVGALDARAFPGQRAAGLPAGQAAQRHLVPEVADGVAHEDQGDRSGPTAVQL